MSVSHYFSGALPLDRIYERKGRRRQVRMDLAAAVAALSAAGFVHQKKKKKKEEPSPTALKHTLIWFATSVNWRMMALTKLKPDNV